MLNERRLFQRILFAIWAMAMFVMMVIMFWLFCDGIVDHMRAKWPHTCTIGG
jgi:hypothetical protein